MRRLLPIAAFPGTMLAPHMHTTTPPPPMFFLWPEFLWLLLAVPLLPAAYVWLMRRRNRLAVRYSSLGVVRAARLRSIGACGEQQCDQGHGPSHAFILRDDRGGSQGLRWRGTIARRASTGP